jgi:hypothetical protein
MSLNESARRAPYAEGFKKSALAVSLALGSSGFATSAMALMPTNATLGFEPGQGSCTIGGIFPNCDYGAQDVTAGSFFSMDANGSGSVEGSEKIPISVNNGIVLGTVQAATGSHSGTPDGTENPDIDEPWAFFGNTGMHQTTSASSIVSDDGGGNVTLDFTGWSVTWNAIPNIPMGGDSANFPSDTGNATVVCAVDCSDADTYVLDYASHVPLGDASNFGGVPYALHLEGIVSAPGAPPITQPDTGATIVGNPVTIDVLVNDGSADGLDPSSVTVALPGPANGAAIPNTTDGTITYTPNTGPDFVGMDSFDYTVDSNLGITSNPTMVDVDVQTNVAPVANDDAEEISTAVLDSNSGNLTITVLANDTDANNDPDLPGGIDTSAVIIISNAVTGTCVANGDGTITYSQTLPTVGATDTCTYKVSDIDSINAPLESNVTSVTINVTATTSDWPSTLDPDIIPVLFFEPGIPGDPVDTSVPALGGTYFTMQVTPTTLIFTVMDPASSGAIVVGHDQPGGNSHTGAPTGDEETVVDLGWTFFANTGFTFTKNGGIVGNSDGTLQFGGDSAVNGGQGRYLITWNGVPEIDLGGDPTGTFPDDLGFGTIACTPAPCEDQSTFELDYAAHVPPGDASGFGGVPYTLKMLGTVGFLDGTLKTSAGAVTSETRILADDMSTSDPDPDVDLQCVGDCFDYTIDGLTANKASIVIPLAGGVPINPVWRILENATWRNFDTTVDIIKSAPFAPGQTECPDPGDAAYTAPPTTGDYCIELTIQDNGLNDLNPAIGSISDPSGMGSGGSAGGGTVFVDTRTSNTSQGWGCSLMANKVAPLQRSDWWLLAGLIGLLGWSRNRYQQ